METIYDVLRALVNGVLRTGGITEDIHKAAHDVINALDPKAQEAIRLAETTLSDEESRLLADLQAKQARAAAAAEADATAPPQVAQPGGGFNQAAGAPDA